MSNQKEKLPSHEADLPALDLIIPEKTNDEMTEPVEKEEKNLSESIIQEDDQKSPEVDRLQALVPAIAEKVNETVPEKEKKTSVEAVGENPSAKNQVSKKAPPHWIITPGLQKLAEHLKEKQKIVFYLQNLRNLCVFLKTRQQAIQPDISLVHRIAPKVRSVVQNLENRIKDGSIAKSLELAGGPGPLNALIAQWTLIKEFENNITQLVLYQTPEQPAETISFLLLHNKFFLYLYFVKALGQ